MASRVDVSKVVAVLSAAYPNWAVSEYTAEVYYEDLKDIPTEELSAAAQHCRTEIGRKFAPSVGELRGAVAELRSFSNNVPSSFQAWQEVITQMRDNGGDFGNPVWSHALVERVVRTMGWRELRMSENQVADRARFIQCYEQLQERATREDLLLPEVRGYLEVNGARLLAPADQIKQLSERLGMK